MPRLVTHSYDVVAGEIDTIELLQGRSIHDVIDNIKAQAIEKAIRAGADPGETN